MAIKVSYDHNSLKKICNGTIIATIDYNLDLPSDLSKCKLSNYIVYELKNIYFNKESDIFKIEVDDEFLGYIFPVQSLDGDRHIEDEWEKMFSYMAASWIIKNKNITDEKSFLDILYKTDLQSNEKDYNPPAVLIINTFEKSFNINNYRLSLLLYGYQQEYEDCMINNIKRSDGFLDGEKKINLKNNKKLTDRHLTEIIFNRLIFSSETMPYRFLILYQSFEYLMKLNQIDKIKNYKKSFKNLDLTNPKILKTATRYISNLDSEKNHLKDVFEKVKILPNYRDDINLFYSDYKNVLGIDETPNEYLVIYSVRNNLFHSYRNYFENTDFDKLLYKAFLVLIELLISKYNMKS